MQLRLGKFQFIYNVGDGDIRTYDIFEDGQIMERVAKSGETNYVSADHALERLDVMMNIATKEYEMRKRMPFLNKTSQTKLEILKLTRRFIEDHGVDERDVRWF